jgi:hypothetical protein
MMTMSNTGGWYTPGVGVYENGVLIQTIPMHTQTAAITNQYLTQYPIPEPNKPNKPNVDDDPIEWIKHRTSELISTVFK